MALTDTAGESRGFQLKKLREPQYRHWLWLLFFPVYWLRYPLIESLVPAGGYFPIYCPLDDRIPFCEWFLIPYMAWMVCLVVMALYTARYDVDTFRCYMKFLAVSMTLSTVIYLVYPSCQQLRPAQFPRDNLLTRLVGVLYSMDTNTNVFPSEHAIGAIGVFLAAARSPRLRTPGRLTVIGIAMGLVCFSTVFLKQHSILDLAAAVPVCAIAWLVSRRKRAQAAP